MDDRCIYEYLGAHISHSGEWSFRLWAPNAFSVSLVGDFCDWESGLAMTPTESGVWELTVESGKAKLGDKYKYKITGANGTHLKTDPCGAEMESGWGNASVLCNVEAYRWRDSGWRRRRQRKAESVSHLPMNIYELHLHSWKRKDNGQPLSYGELARELAPYVKQMGYTHIELMPMDSRELGDCCGYRRSSFFAPDPSLGSPLELAEFVDSMHEAGIGVILDISLEGFSSSENGLCELDGSQLYEAEERCQRGGFCKTFRRDSREVKEFLISSVLYWLDKYHIDGIRIDRVDPQWSLFEELGCAVRKDFPDALLIAGEVIGKDAETHTLPSGFRMSWSREWAQAALDCALTYPFEREQVYGKLVEAVEPKGDRILTVSHCDALGGKGSMLERISGDYWQKFAGARALLGYMMTLPGKKLTFMGSEIGEFRQWKNSGELEWFLLDHDYHAMLQRYCAELNQLYLRSPELWSLDADERGFEWICKEDSKKGVLSYKRADGQGNELIVLVNIMPNAYEGYGIGVPKAGKYREIFNSDSKQFGGSGVVNNAPLESQAEDNDGFENSINISVPPLAITILKRVG